MNTNNDGTPVTTEQLEAWALTVVDQREFSARKAALHNEALWTSWLRRVTDLLRFELMTKGELVLRTRTFDPPSRQRTVVDPWWFTRREASGDAVRA